MTMIHEIYNLVMSVIGILLMISLVFNAYKATVIMLNKAPSIPELLDAFFPDWWLLAALLYVFTAEHAFHMGV